MTETSLSNMNRHMRANIETLVRFWGKIYKEDKAEYEKLADGLEAVHEMLLANTEKFISVWKATFYCYNTVRRELQHASFRDRAGFEAAKDIFERRLK